MRVRRAILTTGFGRIGMRSAVVVVGLVGIIAIARPSRAAEPRPWLCRDKPVFSSGSPMTYSAANPGGGTWVLTFMRFNLGGGHDGFTVISSPKVTGRIDGKLESGQWYAVALYRSGNHWICPANASENDRPAPGVVSDLCYGEDPGACTVTLTVKHAGNSQ